jgi:acyl carrier protein
MNNSSERLANCFAAVFPNLNQGQILLATPTSVEGWDSITTLTLMSVIEEEFAIEIDPDDIEHLLSFDSALAFLTS